MTATPNRRPGFTLVEMLVATALIIFMMYILASAFGSALTSFRVLKAQGDLQEKLRNLVTTLRTDLAAPHFGGKFYPGNQGPYLSHQRLNDQTWTPPEMGYFRLAMPVGIANPGSTPQIIGFTPEGLDPDTAAGVASLQHFLLSDPSRLYMQFTVNMTDGHPAIRDARGRRDQFASTDAVGVDRAGVTDGVVANRIGGMHHWNKPDYNINDVPFSSNWSEVAYWLQPNGQNTGAVPLYTLYRRQKLLVEPSATAAVAVAGMTSPPLQSDSRYPLYLRVNPSDPAYPPRTLPRVLTDQGETDRDLPDLSTWFRYTSRPAPSQPFPEYVFNSPADVTRPVRRWGMSTLLPSPYQLTSPPPAHGQPQAQPPFQPFYPILTEAGLSGPAYAEKLAPRIGGDIVLTDIVHFEVKLLWEPVRKNAPNTDKFYLTPNAAVPVAPEDGVEPQLVSDTYGNPDYPFDRLPPFVTQANPNPVPVNPAFRQQSGVRVFDTWSANNDTSGAVKYYYGVDPNAVDMRDYVNRHEYVAVNTKATSPADPDWANWNAGHFRPQPPLPVPPQPPALPPMPPQPPPQLQWNAGQPTQPNAGIPTQNTNIPLRVRVRAVQIKVRVWDRKTSQTRQITIIQDV